MMGVYWCFQSLGEEWADGAVGHDPERPTMHCNQLDPVSLQQIKCILTFLLLLEALDFWSNPEKKMQSDELVKLTKTAIGSIPMNINSCMIMF